MAAADRSQPLHHATPNPSSDSSHVYPSVNGPAVRHIHKSPARRSGAMPRRPCGRATSVSRSQRLLLRPRLLNTQVDRSAPPSKKRAIQHASDSRARRAGRLQEVPTKVAQDNRSPSFISAATTQRKRSPSLNSYGSGGSSVPSGWTARSIHGSDQIMAPCLSRTEFMEGLVAGFGRGVWSRGFWFLTLRGLW
jgi:hypothetical protein